MASKSAVKQVCQECGTWHAKWVGKCEGCGSWNTLVEETVSVSKKTHPLLSPSLEFASVHTLTEEPFRTLTGMAEFDRVCGGGLVPGSVLLVGGDPGIGKSTLLLQVASSYAHQGPCAYVSGEEGISQIQMRAMRLSSHIPPHLKLATGTKLQGILEALKTHTPPFQLVVIDSIQTILSEDIDSSPGTVSQVRACTYGLIQLAKEKNITVILVGHVTKEGVIAGPRVLEHMVDTVLHFEGDRHHHYRLLRSVKNRFGPTDEMGVFEMTGQGLREVQNPSALFLNDHETPVTGSAVFAGLEGTRPLLVEIQALVAPSYLPSPRRTSVGWDSGRLAMILAVLETRCGLSFGGKDIYLNVAGGLKITEPAADLAAAAALVSAFYHAPSPEGSVFFGEIGLSGEIRPVSQIDLRLRESEKLGFGMACFSHRSSSQRAESLTSSLASKHLTYLMDLLSLYRDQ